MDCLHNSSALTRKIFKGLHDTSCSERIKPCSRLIQKDKTRISNQFNTNWCPLSFSTRNTFDEWTTNFGILTLAKSELADDLINSLQFLIDRSWKLKLGSKLKTFSDCHSLEKDIILLDVSAVSLEPFYLFSINSIDYYISSLVKLLRDQPAWKIVKESRFTCSRSSDDAQKLARQDWPTYVVENGFWLRSLLLSTAASLWIGSDKYVFPVKLNSCLSLSVLIR